MRPGVRLLSLCFFLSGAAALTYQVIWIRMLGWFFGTTTLAVATTVAAFMAGLALGSWLGGRWVERQSHLIRAYVGVEGMMGLAGLGLTLGLNHLTGLSVWLYHNVPAPLLPLARFLLLFALLMVPTTLMGVTMPILARYVVSRPDEVARLLGRLYALNTAGAVLGALATDFWLIPTLGVTATGLSAAGLNLAVAALAWLGLARQDSAPLPPAESDDRPPPLWLLVGFCGSGMAALALEVLWTRSLVFFMGCEVFVFSLILAVFLSGLALGASLARGWAGRVSDPSAALALVQSLLALLTLGSLGAIAALKQVLATLIELAPGLHPWTQYVLKGAAACLVVMLPATLLMGATFPLFMRLGAEAGTVGRRVGLLYAWNTVGSAVGSLLAGFVLLPQLGLQRAILTVAALTLGLALMTALHGRRSLPVVGLTALALVFGFSLPSDTILARTYQAEFGPLAFFREAPEGTVAVATLRDFDRSEFRRLIVNGFSMTGTTFKSQRYMKLLGHLPSLLHPAPRRSLVICLGTGMTLSALAAHPEYERIDCVDLSATVRQALPLFEYANQGVWKDPRVHIRIDDGRNYLLNTEARYDVITFEPPPPRNAGIVNLYSREYYQLCRQRLNPGGLVCQWLPVHQLRQADVKACIRAFTDVFPNTTLWTNFAYTDLCLLGSMEPLPLSPERLRERLARTPLDAIGVEDAESLLSTYLHGPESLKAYTADTLPLTDDRPTLEYSFLSGLDIDLDYLLARRESVRPLLSDPPDEARLKAGEILQDSVHQYYILEIAGLVRGDLDQLRWQQDQMGDTIHRVAPSNLYGRYVLWATDPYKTYLEQELARRPQDRALLWALARWQRFRGELSGARATLLKLDPEQDGEVAWALFCVDAAGRRAWAELVLKVCPDPVRQGIARKTLDAEPPRR